MLVWIPRPPTARERWYLESLARGERRPTISGKAGYLCRKFGWCEVLFVNREGREVPRSRLPYGMDAMAVVRAGYRAVGFILTQRGCLLLSERRGTSEEPYARLAQSQSLAPQAQLAG